MLGEQSTEGPIYIIYNVEYSLFPKIQMGQTI